MKGRTRYLLYAIGFLMIVSVGILEPIEYLTRSAVAPLNGLLNSPPLTEDEALKLTGNAKIKQLEQENKTLRKAISVDKALGRTIVARVISHSPHTASNRITINKGSDSGLRAGQAVLVDGLVIGTTKEIGVKEAEIILLDDQEFRLEVIFGENRGVLKGSINGSIIDRVLPDAKVQPKQLVVTAGSRTVPASLPVGRVVAQLVTAEKVFRQVQFATSIDLDRLSYVQVVR